MRLPRVRCARNATSAFGHNRNAHREPKFSALPPLATLERTSPESPCRTASPAYAAGGFSLSRNGQSRYRCSSCAGSGTTAFISVQINDAFALRLCVMQRSQNSPADFGSFRATQRAHTGRLFADGCRRLAARDTPPCIRPRSPSSHGWFRATQPIQACEFLKIFPNRMFLSSLFFLLPVVCRGSPALLLAGRRSGGRSASLQLPASTPRS
jgi:hypothetical protein